MGKEILEKIINGDRRAAAKLITLVENNFSQAQEILKRLYNYTGSSGNRDNRSSRFRKKHCYR